MINFFKNPKFKNVYFWVGLLGVIFGAAGVDFNTLTNWQLFGEAILSILGNPVAIVSVVAAVVGIWNNNDTPGIDKPLLKNKED